MRLGLLSRQVARLAFLTHLARKAGQVTHIAAPGTLAAAARIRDGKRAGSYGLWAVLGVLLCTAMSCWKPSAALRYANLHEACLSGDLNAVKEFLRRAPESLYSRDSVGATVLHEAAYGRCTAVAKYLLSLGAEAGAVDAFGYTPLHCAALVDAREIGELLLRAGVPADAVGTSRHNGPSPTSLEIAAMRGHVEFAELLLDWGATPGRILPDGSTPLHQACVDAIAGCYEGRARGDRLTSMIRLLLKRGATVDQRDAVGATPLHTSVASGNAEAVRLLLELGADINARDAFGDSPLHALAKGIWDQSNRDNELIIAELLLASGADPGAVNSQGDTAADVAEKRNRSRLAAMIRSHAAVRGTADGRQCK